MVASINKLKSNSFKLALAVNRSKNVSKGDRRSADGKAARPEIIQENYNAYRLGIRKL